MLVFEIEKSRRMKEEIIQLAEALIFAAGECDCPFCNSDPWLGEEHRTSCVVQLAKQLKDKYIREIGEV